MKISPKATLKTGLIVKVIRNNKLARIVRAEGNNKTLTILIQYIYRPECQEWVSMKDIEFIND